MELEYKRRGFSTPCAEHTWKLYKDGFSCVWCYGIVEVKLSQNEIVWNDVLPTNHEEMLKFVNRKEDNAEKTLEARWCVDSETGKRYLLDLKTGQILLNFDEFYEGYK